MKKLKLYSDNTPNGWKMELMLAELGLQQGKDYEFIRIDIGKGEQFAPEFLRVSPNNKIPALAVHNADGAEELTLFESGAILIYLAEEYKSPLLPTEQRARYSTLVWLMFQMGGLGPMLGQAYHFNNSAPEKVPYAIARYNKESDRLYGVMDRRLQQTAYLVGDGYTIADVASFPWILSHSSEHNNLGGYPHVHDWYKRILERPAAQQLLQRIG